MAWKCAVKGVASAWCPASRVSSLQPEPAVLVLCSHQDSFPYIIFPQMIMKAGESSHLLLTVQKINTLPKPAVLFCLFALHLQVVQRHLSFPNTCFGMDEETQETWEEGVR